MEELAEFSSKSSYVHPAVTTPVLNEALAALGVPASCVCGQERLEVPHFTDDQKPYLAKVALTREPFNGPANCNRGFILATCQACGRVQFFDQFIIHQALYDSRKAKAAQEVSEGRDVVDEGIGDSAGG